MILLILAGILLTFSPLFPGERPVDPIAAYGRLLERHVREGRVDYRGIDRDRVFLDRYFGYLASTDPASLSGEGELAFWINAYNAFTIKLILNNRPARSGIREIPSSERWKGKLWDVGGEIYSLDQIEHEILRKKGEPRIHFALVCAARSCPDLRSEPYEAAVLEEQLADQTRIFLADKEKGSRLEGGKDGKETLYLSRIFDWFEEDFLESAPSVIDFILPWLPGETRASIEAGKEKIVVRHLTYDWRLNGPSGEGE